MGSFPNMVAGQLLKAIFVLPRSSGALAGAANGVASMYNSDATTTLANGGGFFTANSAGGVQLLYLGLIIHPGAVGGNTVIANAMTDATITSNTNDLAGQSWSATAGGASAPGISVECVDQNYNRVTFSAALTNTVDGATIATVTLPSTAAVNFATTGMNAAVTGAAVGFFISSFAGKGTGVGLRPHVIAYGQLSTAKALGVGDQPTFAQNAITITLD